MKRYCVNLTYTIKEVIEQFETNNDRVAVVLNGSNKVVGVVSQGDILRALSAGMNMYTQISNIIQQSYLHLYEKDMDKAYKIFRQRRITLLPILNYNNELEDIITLNEVYEYCEKINS